MARDRMQAIAAAAPFGGAAAVLTATIANTESLSEIVDLGALRLAAIGFPAEWTAAALSFKAGYDGATVADLLDGTGTEYQLAVTAGKVQIVTLADFLAFSTLQLRSGLSGAAVAQEAERVFTLYLVP